MKKIYLTLITLLFIISANAQFGVQKSKIDEIKSLKEKPLKVVFAYEKGELAKKGFNEYLKKVINEIWTFSPSVEFISPEIYKTLLKDKKSSDSYAYLEFIKYNWRMAPGNSFIISVQNDFVVPHYVTIYNDEDTNYSYGDIYFCLKRLHSDLVSAVSEDRKELKKYRRGLITSLYKKDIENKTLLIDENQIIEEFKKEIIKYYPYDYQLVTKDFIDKVITEEQANYVVIKKIMQVTRPITKTSPGTSVSVADRHNSQISSTSSHVTYFNSLYDTEKGKVIYLGYPRYNDKKLEETDFKRLKNAIK
ncbi:hypothetical protein [Thalassobellus sediminis]|uniref:hypothetical protein n=1 Tax=Thalassobellus sediminis TaxID=3367753 RepID=UPI0037B22D2D